MKLKSWQIWAVVVAMLGILIGCGGGGGGGGTSSTGSTGGTISGLQVTGYEGNTSGPMLDLRSLVPGDTVQLAITGRDTNNNLVVKNVSGWSTNAPSTVATVTSTGVLTVTGSSSTTYVVTVSYNSATYTANLIAQKAQAFVTGSINDGSVALQNALIEFYNASGTQVGTCFSTREGTFRASVPTTAVGFTIDLSGPDPGSVFFYDEFSFNKNVYIEGSSCLAKLSTSPSLTTPLALPTPVVPYLRSLGPPPPPTGCL